MTTGIYLNSIKPFAPIWVKIGVFGPYIEPNDPRGGIFRLGNIYFPKPDGHRSIRIPLEFCHQGGARGPPLPTRLVSLMLYARVYWREFLI